MRRFSCEDGTWKEEEDKRGEGRDGESLGEAPRRRREQGEVKCHWRARESVGDASGRNRSGKRKGLNTGKSLEESVIGEMQINRKEKERLGKRKKNS